MCGSKPQAPTIIYQGPSQGDLDASRQSLEQYRQQSLAQQETFASQLQKQIDAANAQASSQRSALDQSRAAGESGLTSQKSQAEADLLGQRQKAELDMAAQRAGANAEMAAQQQTAYGIATTSVTEPTTALTTTAAKPKEKTKGGLKITPGATAAKAGSGLNIGF
jgi:hypothetical protein